MQVRVRSGLVSPGDGRFGKELVVAEGEEKEEE